MDSLTCTLCPRNCGVDRRNGQRGYCQMPAKVMAARAALHMWEEPCISGTRGSGAVFFSGCTLGCCFCQNREIAVGKAGKVLTQEALARIFLNLQRQGAANINLVTASHFVPQVIRALDIARDGGLHLPVVYNCGGYEKVETLRLLEGYVDVWLPDFKYMEPELAASYSQAPDYVDVAKAALDEMVRQTKKTVFDADGYMVKGVIVRHLILPGHTKNSRKVLEYLYRTYGDRIYISLMNQYTPLPQMADRPPLNRKVTRREYGRVLDFALDLGIKNGFFQEGDTAKESFIPAFDYEGLE